MILSNIKAIGGSYYALIPKSIYEKLNLEGDKEILCDFVKYVDVIKTTISDFYGGGEEINIKHKESNEVISGFIQSVDAKAFTLLSKEKYYVFLYSNIENVDSVENKQEENQDE